MLIVFLFAGSRSAIRGTSVAARKVTPKGAKVRVWAKRTQPNPR